MSVPIITHKSINSDTTDQSQALNQTHRWSLARSEDSLQETTKNLLLANICFSNLVVSFLVKPISAIYVSYALSTGCQKKNYLQVASNIYFLFRAKITNYLLDEGKNIKIFAAYEWLDIQKKTNKHLHPMSVCLMSWSWEIELVLKFLKVDNQFSLSYRHFCCKTKI